MFCHLCDDMEIKLIGFSVNSAEGQRSAAQQRPEGSEEER